MRRRPDRQPFLDSEQADIVRDAVGAKKFRKMTERAKVRAYIRLLRDAGLLPYDTLSNDGPRFIPDMRPALSEDEDWPPR